MSTSETFIGKDTCFEGNISAGSIVVAGTVRGNLRAENAITISETGSVYGDIQAPTIYVAEGSRHDGLMSLEKPGEESGFEKVDIRQTQSTSPEPKQPKAEKETSAKPASRAKSKLW